MDETYRKQLQAACAGKRTAIDWLMAVERTWLLAHCRRMLPRGIGAIQPEDLVQECSLKFINGHHALHFAGPASFRAWLRKVARNHWLNSKCRLRAIQNDSMEEIPAPEKEWCEPPLTHSMYDLRRELPLRQDVAIMLRDYCGCSFELIAEVLDCPTVTAARSLRARGLRSMAQAASE